MPSSTVAPNCYHSIQTASNRVVFNDGFWRKADIRFERTVRIRPRVAGMPVKAFVKLEAAEPGLAQFTSSLGLQDQGLEFSANGRQWRCRHRVRCRSQGRPRRLAEGRGCFRPNFSKKQNLHVGQLAPVSREYRMKVLQGANEAVAAHVLVCRAIKVVGHTLHNFLGQTGV